MTPIELTINTNSEVVGGGKFRAYKIGRIVHVSGYIVAVQYGSNMVGLSIPSALPVSDTEFPMIGQGTTGASGTIKTSGSIYFNIPSASGTVGQVFNFTYITAS